MWLLDGLRRDVNREIRDEVTDRKLKVEIIEWWTLMGEKEDLTITDVRRRDFLDSDNVHLKKRANNLREWPGDKREEKKSGLKMDWWTRGGGEEDDRRLHIVPKYIIRFFWGALYVPYEELGVLGYFVDI